MLLFAGYAYLSGMLAFFVSLFPPSRIILLLARECVVRPGCFSARLRSCVFAFRGFTLAIPQAVGRYHTIASVSSEMEPASL